jgi:hypothetical protein
LVVEEGFIQPRLIKKAYPPHGYANSYIKSFQQSAVNIPKIEVNPIEITSNIACLIFPIDSTNNYLVHIF